jgi:amidohydrolase
MSQNPGIADDICRSMVEWRHDFHAHPETAFEEHRTSQRVAEALEKMGLTAHRGIARTGVVASLKNGDGPSIALRADMDALDILELGDRPYKSTIPGKMHGCGHDGHTAMLLGAAAQLARDRPFRGTVNFIFQPAEENEGGGREMVEDGLFEKFPSDAVYGMHNIPNIPRGRFALREGVATAFLDTFEIVITGRGCHAAMPETGIDPILVSAGLINSLQSIVSRRIGALESAVVSLTQIHGGDTWNVVPETVTLRGTVRTLSAKVQAQVQEEMGQICAGVAQTHGATIALDYRRRYPGVINTPAETVAAASAAMRLVGKDLVQTDVKPAMGSEDFAYMLQERPGAYICLGAGEGPNNPPLHNPHYDFNDAIMPLGAGFWVELVKQQLPAV